MLKDNIKRLRKEKGFSQEELAEKLNVVRQTVSKWENGLSVPDTEMLINIANVLDTQVCVLLDTQNEFNNNSDSESIENKLQSLNIKIEKQNKLHRRIIGTIFIIIFFISLFLLIRYIAVFINYKNIFNDINTETVIIGGNNSPTNIFVINKTLRTIFPVFASIISASSLFGIYKTYKK